jgi:hypothetical protein
MERLKDTIFAIFCHFWPFWVIFGYFWPFFTIFANDILRNTVFNLDLSGFGLDDPNT